MSAGFLGKSKKKRKTAAKPKTRSTSTDRSIRPTHSFSGANFFALLGQPIVQLFPRLSGNIGEAQASTAGFIHPGDLHFRFQRCSGPRQPELCGGDAALRQLAAEENGHAALADVGHGSFQILALAK